MTDAPLVPVSWGELLDKLTILEIKRERIERPSARANVLRELELLSAIGAEALRRSGVPPLMDELREVNTALWEIEDAIREEEERGIFGPEFIGLARSVYMRNDERAAIKRRINALLGSALVEEKSYRGAAETPFMLGPEAA
ncbi:DUF6165 family protein [Sphingomonas sp.]|jgi:hypothetical protein|uniref:DUF6165 family protein n=1 Tax=Sphingomonas sp. TaxID=28214 RepID=UPI002DF5386A|nr:DUF6165 family protein [Sphingomonas sp.]